MNTNPYRDGTTYFDLFKYWQQKQVVTRKELLERGFSIYDINCHLSPREEGKCKGDCRGNVSVQGHLYYAEKLAGKKFRLRWRENPLPAFKRISKGKVVSQKIKVRDEELKVPEYQI